MGFALGAIHAVGLMTRICHYSVTQSRLTALRIPRALLFSPPWPRPPAATDPPTAPWFCLFQNVAEVDPRGVRPLQTGLSHSAKGDSFNPARERAALCEAPISVLSLQGSVSLLPSARGRRGASFSASPEHYLTSMDVAQLYSFS